MVIGSDISPCHCPVVRTEPEPPCGSVRRCPARGFILAPIEGSNIRCVAQSDILASGPVTERTSGTVGHRRTKALAAVWISYYALFYTESELNESFSALPRAHHAQRVDSTMARMEPWLLKRGLCRDRCGDATCIRLDCLLRLAACKLALK